MQIVCVSPFPSIERSEENRVNLHFPIFYTYVECAHGQRAKAAAVLCSTLCITSPCVDFCDAIPFSRATICIHSGKRVWWCENQFIIFKAKTRVQCWFYFSLPSSLVVVSVGDESMTKINIMFHSRFYAINIFLEQLGFNFFSLQHTSSILFFLLLLWRPPLPLHKSIIVVN